MRKRASVHASRARDQSRGEGEQVRPILAERSHFRWAKAIFENDNLEIISKKKLERGGRGGETISKVKYINDLQIRS